MLNLSLGNFFYLFMRLFPFIIVCFFVIISIFNWDLRGFVYLVGLIITTGFFQLIGDWFNAINEPNAEDKDRKTCVRMFDTNLPVNLIVIGFTIGYLFTTIGRIYITNKQSFFDVFDSEYNSIILFFIIIAMSDFFINTNILPVIPGVISPNYCYRWEVWFFILSITVFCGLIWANIIYSTKNENYVFFNNFNKPFRKCAINNAKYICKTKNIVQTKNKV